MTAHHLFRPISIGHLELKNRLVMLPMETRYAENDRVGACVKSFFVERAKGGVGLMFLGSVHPVDLGEAAKGCISLGDDHIIADLRDFTDAAHSHGAKIGAQLVLTYLWRRSPDAPVENVVPSEGAMYGPGIRSARELTRDEIHRIVDQYGEAARRAREGGFDIVDVCCLAGYLLNRFLSPLTNKRSDEYGGSLENRMRILLEVVARVKQKAGADFPVACRLTMDDFLEGGVGIEEAKIVAAALERAGVNMIVSYAGWHECRTPTSQASVSPGAFLHLTEQIKAVVGIPVVATNRIDTWELAESIIAGGRADLVGMARNFMADPEFASKVQTGRTEEIRPCICCNRCIDSNFEQRRLSCTVNPLAGNEWQSKIGLVERPKKVLVVGGGPAGMEAAAVAAERGHAVTLWEERDVLGGQLIAGCVPPHKERIARLRTFMAQRVERTGVKVALGKKATAPELRAFDADAVIVATGAQPIVPNIHGIDSGKVVTSVDLLLGQRQPVGSVVVIGGGSLGCEVAEFVATKGHSVVILEMLDRIADNVGPTSRWVLLKRLRDLGVEMVSGAKVLEIAADGVRATKDGQPVSFEADTVVISVGLRPEQGLLQEGEAAGVEAVRIGDCVQARKIAEAIGEGFDAAMRM